MNCNTMQTKCKVFRKLLVFFVLYYVHFKRLSHFYEDNLTIEHEYVYMFELMLEYVFLGKEFHCWILTLVWTWN